MARPAAPPLVRASGGPVDSRSSTRNRAKGAPLDVIRVVFEKGLEIRRIDGRWLLQSAMHEMEFASPTEVSERFGTKPLLLTRHNSSSGERTLLLSEKGELLGLDISELQSVATTKGVSVVFQTLNLAYLLGALYYHCQQLVDRYAEICDQFTRIARIPGAGLNSIATFGGQMEPYYEFEALITAALRSYDAMRYVLWNAFSGGYGVPNSFARTLEKMPALPADLRQRLEFSWSQYGSKLKEYRDCIQHYIPVGGPLPFARMELLEGSVWSTTVRIPDNPEVRSFDAFRYESHLNALTFGWKLANEVVEVACILVDAVPDQEASEASE